MRRKIQPNEIYIERVYDATVEAVWDAWTDPAKVEKWWGPRGFTLTTHSKDLRPGGHWHYTMHGPDGTDYPNKTYYHEVEKARKLVYDHGANDHQPPLFRVTAVFSEVDGGTKLQLTMELASPEAAEAIKKFVKQAGGNATWDRLAEFLADRHQGQASFVINRSFPASVDAVYRAWTTPEQLCSWLPPTGFNMVCIQADIRPGGRCLARMEGEGGISFCAQFDYLECTPEKIVYTQRFCTEAGQPAKHPGLPEFPESLLNVVRIVEEEDGMTRVTLTTVPCGKPTPVELKVFMDIRGSMTLGWSASFDALESIVEGS